MRAIAEKFTNEEFEEIALIKEKTKMSWHDFIIASAKALKERKGQYENNRS